MQIVFSGHATERMLQRGINEATVKNILQSPDYIRTSFSGRKIATKKLDKAWHVIFLEEENRAIVISAYFD
ncbi:MAG: DUF4258 domain-containing protein [archaeon]